MKYIRVNDGDWVYPKRKGYKLACCDCGLVHTVDFELVKRGRGYGIRFRPFRNKRATAAMRRGKK